MSQQLLGQAGMTETVVMGSYERFQEPGLYGSSEGAQQMLHVAQHAQGPGQQVMGWCTSVL